MPLKPWYKVVTPREDLENSFGIGSHIHFEKNKCKLIIQKFAVIHKKVGVFLNVRAAHGVGGKAGDVFEIFHFSMSVIA